jgi:hypothetical protein
MMNEYQAHPPYGSYASMPNEYHVHPPSVNRPAILCNQNTHSLPRSQPPASTSLHPQAQPFVPWAGKTKSKSKIVQREALPVTPSLSLPKKPEKVVVPWKRVRESTPTEEAPEPKRRFAPFQSRDLSTASNTFSSDRHNTLPVHDPPTAPTTIRGSGKSMRPQVSHHHCSTGMNVTSSTPSDFLAPGSQPSRAETLLSGFLVTPQTLVKSSSTVQGTSSSTPSDLLAPGSQLSRAESQLSGFLVTPQALIKPSSVESSSNVQDTSSSTRSDLLAPGSQLLRAETQLSGFLVAPQDASPLFRAL